MKKSVLFLFLFPYCLIAQVDSIKTTYDNVTSTLIESLENLLEEQDENVDISESIPEYVFGKGEKIEINDLSAEIAYSILQLSEYQYYQLQLYLENYGALVSLYELYAIEGFSKADVERILPFFKISAIKKSKMSFKQFFNTTKHRILLRYGQVIEPQRGYSKNIDNGYSGSPSHLLFRYQVTHPRFSLGISGEKDAGEEFFKGAQKSGFDFYAFHLSIKNISIVKQIVLGDYRFNYGQGLVLGSGFSSGKSGTVHQVRKFSTGISPVTPLNESRFLRGAAVEVGNCNYKGTLFWGYRTYDGKIVTENDEFFFSGSLTPNGNHRTHNEIAKKNALLSQNYGFNFQCNRKIFRIGITGLMTHFALPIFSSPIFYKKYDCSGKNNFTIGIDHQIILKKSIVFGELAMSKGSHLALLQGIITDIDPRLKTLLLFRYYDKSFNSLEGSAFGENQLNRNEVGLYVVSQLLLGRYAELHVGYDVYHFPWLKYQIEFPSYGHDISITFMTSLSKYCKLLFRYKYKESEKNIAFDYYNGASCRRKHKFRGAITTSLFSMLTLKTQIDYVVSAFNKEVENHKGVLLLQDIDVDIPKTGIKIKGRFALFDTDSFEERIYVYEKDLLFAFTSNAYFGKGCRFYCILQYDYTFFQLQLRYSQTYYIDRQIISSGLTRIEGPVKSDIKLQLYFKL